MLAGSHIQCVVVAARHRSPSVSAAAAFHEKRARIITGHLLRRIHCPNFFGVSLRSRHDAINLRSGEIATDKVCRVENFVRVSVHSEVATKGASRFACQFEISRLYQRLGKHLQPLVQFTQNRRALGRRLCDFEEFLRLRARKMEVLPRVHWTPSLVARKRMAMAVHEFRKQARQATELIDLDHGRLKPDTCTELFD